MLTHSLPARRLQPYILNSTEFTSCPTFLEGIPDDTTRGFMQIVNSYWSLLIRETNTTAACGSLGTGQQAADGCTSSLIPVKNPTVVPGVSSEFRSISPRSPRSLADLDPLSIPSFLLPPGPIQRELLLGQLLHLRRAAPLSALPHRQVRARELHGYDQSIRLHTERSPAVLPE